MRTLTLALLVAVGLSTSAHAGVLIISSAHVGDDDHTVRAHTFAAGETLTRAASGSLVRVTTDLGVNRIYGRDLEGSGPEAGSLWGANFRAHALGGPVHVTARLRVDGSATLLGDPEDEAPAAFNYYLQAVSGRVEGFDTDQEDGDIDAIFSGAHATLSSDKLCESGDCGLGAVDRILRVEFDVAAGADFFLYGLLQLGDLHATEFDFEHTALLQSITVSNGASLTSDSGVLISTGDGAYNFGSALAAAVPEPSTWALMIAGFGWVGASLRRRRPVHV